MHEAALAQAASPRPATILGLALRPYSIGHELQLLRSGNALVLQETKDPPAIEHSDLSEAAIVCCQSWTENQQMDRDWLLGLKLRIWKRRVRRLQRREGKHFFEGEAARFAQYRAYGSLEFPMSDRLKPGSSQRRAPGTPFLLRLHQFLMVELHKSELEAWDYPLGLAKMRWQCWLEESESLEIYNHHDAEFDAFVAEQEAQMAAEAAAQPKEAPCPA